MGDDDSFVQLLVCEHMVMKNEGGLRQDCDDRGSEEQHLYDRYLADDIEKKS